MIKIISPVANRVGLMRGRATLKNVWEELAPKTREASKIRWSISEKRIKRMGIENPRPRTVWAITMVERPRGIFMREK